MSGFRFNESVSAGPPSREDLLTFETIKKIADKIFNIPLDFISEEDGFRCYLGQTEDWEFPYLRLYVEGGQISGIVSMSSILSNYFDLRTELDVVGWFSLIKMRCQELKLVRRFEVFQDFQTRNCYYEKGVSLFVDYSNGIFSFENSDLLESFSDAEGFQISRFLNF